VTVDDAGRTFIDPDYIVAEAERILSRPGLAREIRDMNLRVARRRELAPEGRDVPIDGPSWAGKVVDIGDELLAIHKDTAEPYPVDPHDDLTSEEHAVVVIQRLLLAGMSEHYCEAVIRAFGLPRYAVTRLVRQLREA
jgi:hypothetical protein